MLILLQVEDFIKLAKEQAASFLTNNIMMTMGEDFNYQGNPQAADPPPPPPPPTGIGDQYSQTISNLGYAALLRQREGYRDILYTNILYT